MKRFVMAVTLAIAVSGTALAGDIPSTDVISPNPADRVSETQPGDIPTSDFMEEVTDLTLSALLSVLGV